MIQKYAQIAIVPLFKALACKFKGAVGMILLFLMGLTNRGATAIVTNDFFWKNQDNAYLTEWPFFFYRGLESKR